MHLGSRAPESDLAHYTPKAQLFQALKQRTFSGENFNLLLSESGLHWGRPSSDANQPLEEVEDESPQSAFQVSPPVYPPDASPEENGGTKRVNVSAQSQVMFQFISHTFCFSTVTSVNANESANTFRLLL